MKFIKEFSANPVQIGAIAASSRGLAELITHTADLGNKKCVVEFGSGDGVFTEKILQRINSGCVFFALEINDRFVKMTKHRCKNAIVYNDSAANINKYLNLHNKRHCDCIISGLPWAAFDRKLQNTLLEVAYDSLEKDGVFLTFAYIQGLLLPSGRAFKQLVNSKFKIVKKTKVVWWNLPPAFVYYCKKK